MSTSPATFAFACLLLVSACGTDDGLTAGQDKASGDAMATGSSDHQAPSPDASTSQEGSAQLATDAFVETASVDVEERDVATADHPGAADSSIGLALTLQGARWELPCGGTVEDGRVCEYSTACMSGNRSNFDKNIAFGGSVGTVYDVALRIRGVVEPRKYLGGQADATHFRTGGLPDTDPSTNLYAVYSIEVSSPKQIYYINDDTSTGHRVFSIDHQKTIPIEGGASIHLVASDTVPPCYQARNCMPDKPVCTPFIIDGIPPAPAAYDGQFIQIDVLSVTPKP
jgi:hypothetical protein